MRCPVCQVPMYVAEFEQIELDLCAGCAGVWFDRGELELVLEASPVSELLPAESDEKPRSCPICRSNMNKVNIGPGQRVLIDECPAGCGLWFDRGELKDLVADFQQTGWRLPDKVHDFLVKMFG